jgi:hypothetical protein
MPHTARAGAAALVAAPAIAIASAIIAPTLSDDPAQQLTALTDHHAAAVAALALSTIAIILLIAGMIWFALAINPHSPGLAIAGGTLGVLGALVVLFDNGIAAAAPSVVRGLDPPTGTAALERVHSSTAVAGLEPLSLLGDIGLALLGVAVLRAGAPRLTAAIIAGGAIGEGIGFATANRTLVIASFVILLLGLAQAVRTLAAGPPTSIRRRVVQESRTDTESRIQPWPGDAEAQRTG